MKGFFSNITDFNKSVFYSLVLHILLILLLMLFHSGLDLPDSEFAQIAFVSSSSTRPQDRIRQQPARQSTPGSQPSSSSTATEVEEAKAPPVNLPKRRLLEDEDEITRRAPGKLTPQQSSLDDFVRTDTRTSEGLEKPYTDPSSTKDFSAPMTSEMEGKDITGPSSDIGTTGGQPFTIEGEAADRTIIRKVLPQYPPGQQREAVIKIRFTVLPDGRVSNMIPVRKGDPVLDEITTKALRQWRFNAIPEDEEQKNVQGIITFVYKLK